VFFSGNDTTVVAGGALEHRLPPTGVNDPIGPYGGQNPPPNDGTNFKPPQNPNNPAPPKVSLIVRKDASGKWIDDNHGDWTDLVSGRHAGHSGRPVGWDLSDNDLAIIDTATSSVSYARHLMNICMAVGVNPATGDIAVLGTEATNEVRFEPNVQGRFTRVEIARVAGRDGRTLGIVDLNPHLDYSVATLPQSERDKSLGDPRGIAWNAAGTKGYVTGMGSNNLVVIDGSGSRAGLAPTIPVGEGPTGIVLDAARGRLLVLDKFESAISVVDLQGTRSRSRVLPRHRRPRSRPGASTLRHAPPDSVRSPAAPATSTRVSTASRGSRRSSGAPEATQARTWHEPPRPEHGIRPVAPRRGR
jgi:hypothetical protein